MTQEKLNNQEEKAERKTRRTNKTTRRTTKAETKSNESAKTVAKSEVKEKNKDVEKSSRNTRKTSSRNTRKPREKRENKIKENTEPKDLVVRGENAIVERKTTKKHENIFKKPKLKIIPLGGLHEVGKNITVFEYDDEIIVVDCGLSFPEDDMLGVDLVIPDITYLKRNEEKIKGLIITHGHEDHIGSVPYLLKQIDIPVYAPKLAMGLIRNKLGKYFEVEFIRSTHSIPDSVMLAIKTPVGTILHTGDFKVDYTPIDGKIMDLGRIAELGNEGILALMSDSTNAERKGFTMSESSIGPVFDELFDGCTKRIVVATFASNVHRVQQIVSSAVKYHRKIAICGRSMINMITTAKELGYIDCPDDIFIDIDGKNYIK